MTDWANIGAGIRALTPAEANLLLSGGDQFREEHVVRELLGKNFIGPEDYKSIFGVSDVGVVPPIPAPLLQSY